MVRRKVSSTTRNSSESSGPGSGTVPVFSNSAPRCTSRVASPPSSRIMLGLAPLGQRRICSVHRQYSSSVSPFHAKTGTPAAAMAAAAWSWVEKMLHEAQRTSAPSAASVSMSTAVWIVMWMEPAMRAPARGWLSAYSARRAISPGISSSARAISLRPKSASDRSATRWSMCSALVSGISGFLEGGLDLVEGGDGPRVDALVQGQLEGDEVADQHEVEQLGQLALAAGLHLDEPGGGLVGHAGDEVGAAHHLRVLEGVAQGDGGDGLAGEGAVLAPARDLVVAQLRLGVPEGGDLGVLVHLGLPPLGGNSADRSPAVDEGDRPPDRSGQPRNELVPTHDLVAPHGQAAHGLLHPLTSTG